MDAGGGHEWSLVSRYFGFPALADSSTRPKPSENLELLGVALSLSEQRMRLAPGKRVKYAAMARDVVALKVVERETLLELLGRLNFAATFYPMGRQWLHAPWRALRAQYRTENGDVVVSAAIRAQLSRWILELESPEHEGVPTGTARAFPGAADPSALAIYADAALECVDAGFCAWTVLDDELVYVQGEWTADERRDAFICDLELAASTFGLVALTPESSTAFEDLQRGVHFADEELLLVPDEMPVGAVGEFIEDDMIRDAFDLEDE